MRSQSRLIKPTLSELAAVEAGLVMGLVRERALIEYTLCDTGTEHATILLACGCSVTRSLSHGCVLLFEGLTWHVLTGRLFCWVLGLMGTSCDSLLRCLVL